VNDATVDAQTVQVPGPPESIEEMTQQAADAAMAAYRDGITRQTVRLRLDVVYSEAGGLIAGSSEKLNKCLPLAEDFTKRLWGGQLLKDTRSQGIDEDIAMLIYRQSEVADFDTSVFFLAGRDLVTSAKLRNYFLQMNDRLVVLLNSEDATDPFNVRFGARDWCQKESSQAAGEITKTFQETTYYYCVGAVNNWQIVQFHAHPHPWQIWLEDLDYRLVKLGDFDKQPAFEELEQATVEYETANGISVPKKMSKMMKDQSRALKAWAEAPRDPDEGKNP
jgi:hypothetical protein